MPRDRVTFQHYLEYAGWMLVAGVLKVVPRPLMILAADFFGWLLYHVARIRRNTIDEQLTLAFGDTLSPRQRKTIGCKSWQNCVLTFFEFLQPNPILSKGWDTFTEQEGYLEFCRPFVEQGIAGIVITGHIGNWEALGGMAKRENVGLAAVAKDMHNSLVNKHILKTRALRGLEVLQVKLSMKSIVDAIRQGKWVAIVGDQDARKRGIFVDFFGRPASTATGAAYFAYTMNKAILPAFCVRLPDSSRHLKLIISEPIIPDTSADRDTEIHRMTQQHTAALESVIRRYPADYFWLHRRWKTQPKASKDVRPPQSNT